MASRSKSRRVNSNNSCSEAKLTLNLKGNIIVLTNQEAVDLQHKLVTWISKLPNSLDEIKQYNTKEVTIE